MKYILLLNILAICTITDIKERKIHNSVLLLGLIMALLLNAHEGGPSGMLDSLKGLAAGTALFFRPLPAGMDGGRGRKADRHNRRLRRLAVRRIRHNLHGGGRGRYFPCTCLYGTKKRAPSCRT
jgi:hypothetical protein